MALLQLVLHYASVGERVEGRAVGNKGRRLVYDDEAIAAETLAYRRTLIARDLAFQAEILAAIERGDESAESMRSTMGFGRQGVAAPITPEFLDDLKRIGGAAPGLSAFPGGQGSTGPKPVPR
jgi:hypothetical protein